MRKDGLADIAWNVRVSYLRYILTLTSNRACYVRLFARKKASRQVKIELSSGDKQDLVYLSSGEEEESVYLSSGDEDDIIEVKPKPENMEPCCSSSLKD
jgi:hypothetical protein